MSESITRLRILAAIVIVLIIAVDQYTKALAREHLPRAGRMSWAGDTLRLDYAENRGAFLSFGASMSDSMRTAIFTGAVSIGIAFLLFLTFRARTPRHLLPFAVICAGGIANLIDRYTRDGAVTDFMNVGVGELRTGIFNVADMAITGGIVWLLVSDWKADRRDKQQPIVETK